MTILSKAKNWLPGKLFILFIVTIPIHPTINVKVLIGSLAILILFKIREFNSHRFIKNSWDLLLLLVWLFCGLFWTTDLILGFKVLETSFSLIGVPLIFIFIDSVSILKERKIFNAFTIGVFTAASVCLIYALYNFLALSTKIDVFFYYQLTGIINSHPTYFAYYIILSISWLLYELYMQELLNAKKNLYIVMILILLSVLALTGGQTAFISLIFVFAFFFLKYLTQEKRSRQKFVILLISLMLLFLFWIKSDLFNHGQFIDDSWERFELWDSGLKANTNKLFGVGTGDGKLVLEEYFRSNGLFEYARNSYNSHNQFIQIFLSNGIIGLSILLIVLFRPIYLCYKSKYVFGILIFFPFIIYCVTEVFLGRYQGVVFFAMIHQVVVNQYYSSSYGKIANQRSVLL